MDAIKNFERNINRWFPRSRSARLKAVVSAANNYLRARSSGKLKALFTAFNTWKRTDPKEFSSRGRTLEAALRQAISDEVFLRGFDLGQIIPGMISATTLIERKRVQLERMKSYASGDALSFPGNINNARRSTVERRAKGLIQHESRRVGGTAAASLGIAAHFGQSTAWNSPKLRMTHAEVERNQAGVCTSFGEAAAHILTAGMEVDHANFPRVEVVAFKNHVFVIVGRSSNAVGDDGHLPHYSQWGNAWYIVDPWAGAMGHEVIYRQNKDYPYNSMLYPLKLQMGTR